MMTERRNIEHRRLNIEQRIERRTRVPSPWGEGKGEGGRRIRKPDALLRQGTAHFAGEKLQIEK